MNPLLQGSPPGVPDLAPGGVFSDMDWSYILNLLIAALVGAILGALWGARTVKKEVSKAFEEKFGKPCDPDGSFDQPGAPRARDWKDD